MFQQGEIRWMTNVMQGHIVICGWSPTARGVIEQLHSADGDPRRQIVLIDQYLDHCPLDDPYVYFIKGDPTLDETLQRADLKHAETAIVLADWSIADLGLRDAKSTLTTLAIENHHNEVYTVVELMRSENRHHLQRADVDEPICIADLSQRMLVHAALNHGLSKFFSDVLQFGEGSEIYKIRLPAPFANNTFREFVTQASDKFEAIALAVERSGEIHCNPQGEFRLSPDDHVFVLSEVYPHALANYTTP